MWLVHRAGPNYPYDYNRLMSWDNSYQQINTSNYYDAQKHAFLQPGTQGWFQWNYRIYGDAGAPELGDRTNVNIALYGYIGAALWSCLGPGRTLHRSGTASLTVQAIA